MYKWNLISHLSKCASFRIVLPAESLLHIQT